MTDETNIIIAVIYEVIYFDWYIYDWRCPILKVKVNVMHILIENISQSVIDKANITNVII